MEEINEIYIYIYIEKDTCCNFGIEKSKGEIAENDRTLVLEFRGTRSGLGTRGGAACEHSCHSLVRHHSP